MVGYRWMEPKKEAEAVNEDRSAAHGNPNCRNLEMSLMLNGFFSAAAGAGRAWIPLFIPL